MGQIHNSNTMLKVDS